MPFRTFTIPIDSTTAKARVEFTPSAAQWVSERIKANSGKPYNRALTIRQCFRFVSVTATRDGAPVDPRPLLDAVVEEVVALVRQELEDAAIVRACRCAADDRRDEVESAFAWDEAELERPRDCRSEEQREWERQVMPAGGL